MNGEFNQLYKEYGIARYLTVRYTLQQNGVAERMNRTLLEKVRCMLSFSKLSKCFWGEALSTACYLVNRSPLAALGLRTPMEIWSGVKSSYKFLRIFGCEAYYHVKEGKLDLRAKKGIFLGY